MLHVDLDEVVLTPNATHAINTITHNIVWDEGDVILICLLSIPVREAN